MLYLITIFASAFLVFQVQPVMAKLILPVFGGGASIWTACLLFFQFFLLLGYFYAHKLTSHFSFRKQMIIHCIILSISLLFLWFKPILVTSTNTVSDPVIDIVIILMGTVGLPYFVLSSTAPLVQRWFSYVELGKQPYRLYSISNIGSLLAIVSYPFVFEPLLPLKTQTNYWSLGFLAFVLCFFSLVAYLLNKIESTEELSNINQLIKKEQNIKTTPFENKLIPLLWLLLPALGVVMLVSTTNALTQELTPVPFLWLLPLCIYLITFIVCFNNTRWYVRWIWFPLFVIGSYVAIMIFFLDKKISDLFLQVAIYSFILFSACMICHGELAKLKPKSHDKLTLYYLYISLGGFLGSASIAFGAQNIFDRYVEFPIGVLCIYLLFIGSLLIDSMQSDIKYTDLKKRFFFILFGKYKALKLISLLMFIFLLEILVRNYEHGNRGHEIVHLSRNFYGTLAVKDRVNFKGKPIRSLVHGVTTHGTQSSDPMFGKLPAAYYRRDTGVGLALQYAQLQKSINVGVIGLGIGTLALYGRTDDRFYFYEINPDVEVIAKKHFSLIEKSKSQVEISIGDGRILLENQLSEEGISIIEPYDVMVIDAFSSDAIPSHLLTTEALSLYFKHLRSDGLLAIHISNRFLNLIPLIKGLSEAHDVDAYYFLSGAIENILEFKYDAQWVVLTNDKKFAQQGLVKQLITPWPSESTDNIIWTDDYNNLLSILR